MKVKVRLFANLVKYAPQGRNPFSVELKQGASVGDITKHLGIPAEERKITLLNGRHCNNEHTVLNEDDEIVFMTPVEGG